MAMIDPPAPAGRTSVLWETFDRTSLMRLCLLLLKRHGKQKFSAIELSEINPNAAIVVDTGPSIDGCEVSYHEPPPKIAGDGQGQS